MRKVLISAIIASIAAISSPVSAEATCGYCRLTGEQRATVRQYRAELGPPSRATWEYSLTRDGAVCILVIVLH